MTEHGIGLFRRFEVQLIVQGCIDLKNNSNDDFKFRGRDTRTTTTAGDADDPELI